MHEQSGNFDRAVPIEGTRGEYKLPVTITVERHIHTKHSEWTMICVLNAACMDILFVRLNGHFSHLDGVF